jgi:hypothetical protein
LSELGALRKKLSAISSQQSDDKNEPWAFAWGLLFNRTRMIPAGWKLDTDFYDTYD